MNARTEKMVAAVRAAQGPCTVTYECYTDDELAEALETAGVTTSRAAVAWAKKLDKVDRERWAEFHTGVEL